MATSAVQTTFVRTDTLDHLLETLGDIRPGRVLYRPLPGTATERDLLYLLDHEDRLCELVDGILVEKPVGLQESVLAVAIITALQAFVQPRKLGVVSAGDGPMRLRPGLVRMPDAAFISWERIPARSVSALEPIPSIAPDLAVEVLSVSNTPAEMEHKRSEYFRAGARLVWIVDPDARTVAVYTDVRAPDRVLNENETLDGGRVLPGFALKLAELFAALNVP